MNPAFSIVVFTTLAGAAQGLVVALAVATLAGAAPGRGYMLAALAAALLALGVALGASFLHLGHKLRAWRAVLMWRTSWMSREGIVLPAFMAVVGAWALAVAREASPPAHAVNAANAAYAAHAALAVVALLLALLLWLSTAMIYACLRFVQEWAHPLTVVNLTLIGLSSGLGWAGALAVAAGESAFAAAVAPWALAATLTAWAGRVASLKRNASLRPRSTLQSATGLKAERVVQISMGMTASSFNTREFFHRASQAAFARIRLGFLVFGFALPALLLGWALFAGSAAAWWLAVLLQGAGLVAERWFFFAQARHPQNLYYQAVS